jgi:hypothetical protein
MKPYVMCHMNASVDGRILGTPSRMRPRSRSEEPGQVNGRFYSGVSVRKRSFFFSSGSLM